MGKATILIVEDEPILALELSEDLKGAGYNPLPAVNDGDKVIASVREREPDLIIMDVKLFGSLTGIEVAAQIRSFVDTPIMFLSSYPSEKMRSQVERLAPAVYVEKPYEDSRLLETVERLLSRRP